VAPAKYQQHGGVHKTSHVNVFGTKTQHRQHSGLGQYRIRYSCVSDMWPVVFYIDFLLWRVIRWDTCINVPLLQGRNFSKFRMRCPNCPNTVRTLPTLQCCSTSHFSALNLYSNFNEYQYSPLLLAYIVYTRIYDVIQKFVSLIDESTR